MADDTKKQLDALAAQNAALSNQVQMLINKLQGQQAGATAPAKEQVLGQMFQKNPALGVRAMTDVVKEEVRKDVTAQLEEDAKLKERMNKLVAEYPALKNDESLLVKEARNSYARIKDENPSLQDGTKRSEAILYELAVREAASTMGVKSATGTRQSEEIFLLPTGDGKKRTISKSSLKRLTPQIVAAAEALGVDVNDPKNLEELNQYSARFNADRDESGLKYK